MGYISVKTCVKLCSEMCCESTSGFKMTPHPRAGRQQSCASNSALIYSTAQVEVLKTKCILIDFKLGLYALLHD